MRLALATIVGITCCAGSVYAAGPVFPEETESRASWSLNGESGTKGFLAACCGQLSDIETAERYWAEALEVAPKMGETFVRRLDPYQYAVDVEHWLEGLRKAGLIE